MSESQSETTGREDIWVEKYRPQTLDEVVGQDDITDRLKSYVERNDLPNLLFSGSAGIGKCVTGETPVLTNHGIERIENVVGSAEGFSEPDNGLEILTLDETGQFEYTAPSHVFGKTADELIEIETRDGANMTVTPEHRLLVLGHDGLRWEHAEDLNANDRIVRPLRAPMPETDSSIDWMTAMDGDRTLVHVTKEFAERYEIPIEENYVGRKKQVVRELRNGSSVSDIAANTDTPRKTIQKYRREVESVEFDDIETVCSLSFLRELGASRDELRAHVEAIQYVTPQNRRSRPITPPWSVSPELASFIGFVVSEAHLDNGRIKFYNADDSLLDRFEAATIEAFDIETSRGKQKGVPYVEIGSRTLTHYLESCFDVFDGAVGGDGIGSTLVRADEESRAAFLQAVFDSEGHVTEGGILELTQKNEQLITLLSYLLAGFGVPSRRKQKRKSATNGRAIEREYHTLYVSGAQNLTQFEETVGFTLTTKADRLARNTGVRSNPNHDTMPVQAAVDELCESLYLPKKTLYRETLNPESPGRENYQEVIDGVVSAAAAKIERAQEVREQIDRLEASIQAVTRVPATWAGEREQLVPLETRNAIAESTEMRSDQLLTYADGRRTPRAARVGQLLTSIGDGEEMPPTQRVQEVLSDAITQLNVPYSHIAEGTHLRGNEIINLLERDDHSLRSLPRFTTVAERVKDVTAEMLSMRVLESLSSLETLANADFYYDTVRDVREVSETRRVYDLTVPGTRNYVAGDVPTVMHNTTCAVAIARELYGDDWRGNFLELNASDERGIDVVRDRIKNFARASFGGHDYRIIFLDEADSLTNDAQSALRRTMEQFSSNTRFILSCNYSSRIIDPIQSRCAVFRFSPIPDDAVAARIREIAENEGIETTEDGVDALVYAAGGDMRKAINALQAASVTGEVVDEEAVYTITSTARPEDIEAMVTSALEGDFTAARSVLEELLTEKGLAGGDIIDQLHRSVWDFGLPEEDVVRLMDRIGEVDYRITAGANEQVQLEALLATLALDDS